MICLTLYDITGIQDFIFSSSKVKENIGASVYVHELFNQTLNDCLIVRFGEDAVISDWSKPAGLIINSAPHVRSEILYVGGGNALVAFADRDAAVSVTQSLSERLLKDTRCTLGLAVAYCQTECACFQDDWETLRRDLEASKSGAVRSRPVQGLSITRECPDGFPAERSRVSDESKEYLSSVARLTQKKVKDTLFDDLCGKYYHFPLEFDHLGQAEGENHIAVVHIDGNSMGRFINDQLVHLASYDDSVKVLRSMTTSINRIYRQVFRGLVDDLCRALKTSKECKRLALRTDEGRMHLPIRPIVLNGDDVTFVCDGRIGLQLATRFLQRLNREPLVIESEKHRLSACAGVAIVKSHFPFHRAYHLAEALCTSAKQKAKSCNWDNPGCWMDYHILYSGFQLDLACMRQHQYNVPGMGAVTRNADFPQYNLLLRPFAVAGVKDEDKGDYGWEENLNRFRQLKNSPDDGRDWPRSRLKDLRNALFSSEADANRVTKACKSRRYSLPECRLNNADACNSDEPFSSEHQTPYYELLELLDFYLTEFSLCGEGEEGQ